MTIRVVAGALLCGWAAACGGSPAPDAPDAAQAPPADAGHAAEPAPGGPAMAWRPGMLGPGVMLAERTPNVLHGDFNGDGIPDLLAVVSVAGQQLAPDVEIVQPWPEYDEAGGAADLAGGAEVGLAIVHGTGGGGAGDMYLVHDPNPVSVLDAPAGRELEVVEHSELAGEYRLADRARGDVIVVPTEAGIDTYLYWDGSTYRLFAPAEVP